MGRIPVSVYGAWECSANGSYRLYLPCDQKHNLTVSAIWGNNEVPPSGQAIVSIDGQGTESGVWNLATQRVWVCSGTPAFLDFDVTALPENGRITFYFR